MHTYSRDYFML